MSLRNQLNDNDYKNWLKACLGLKYLKEAITSFVDGEVKTFHASIIANICGAGMCNTCTTEIITRRRLRCPNNVCHLFMYEIERNHRFMRPCWKNSDTTKWCSDHWEIGKCFMSPGHETKCSAADTDCTGLLGVCINGLFLPPTLTAQISVPGNAAGTQVDIFHKVRDIRNTLLHTATMAVSDADRQAYLQDMITLLRGYKQPVDQNTQDAIDQLDELNNTDIFINATDELAILNAKLEACQRIVQDADGAIDTLKIQIAASESRQMDTKKELDEHRQQQATETSRLGKNITDTATSLKYLIEKFKEFEETNKDNLKSVDEMKETCESIQKTTQWLHQVFAETRCIIDIAQQQTKEQFDTVQKHAREHFDRVPKQSRESIDVVKKQTADCIDWVQKQASEHIDRVQELAGESLDRVQEHIIATPVSYLKSTCSGWFK